MLRDFILTLVLFLVAMAVIRMVAGDLSSCGVPWLFVMSLQFVQWLVSVRDKSRSS